MDRSRDVLVEERRAEILDAAEGLLAVHGFDALRLRDVSKSAGVSIGLIQHYFTTRDELLYETMRMASARRVEQWSRLAQGRHTATDKLMALLEGSISNRHRCIIWIETCAAATRHPDLLADVQRTQDLWRHTLAQTISEGLTSGEFVENVPAVEVSDLLVNLIDGLILSAAVDAEGSSRQEYRVQLLRDAAQRLLLRD